MILFFFGGGVFFFKVFIKFLKRDLLVFILLYMLDIGIRKKCILKNIVFFLKEDKENVFFLK